jgi:hypothetical protein
MINFWELLVTCLIREGYAISRHTSKKGILKLYLYDIKLI